MSPRRVLVISPNWLGDAVMALPALAGLRAHHPDDRLIVGARRSIAPLFGMVEGVDEILTLPPARAWNPADLAREARTLASARPDVAILLTNSFRTAWVLRRACVPERWGVKADLRGGLLTRAVPRPRTRGRHHSDYYRELFSSLGIAPASGPPRLSVPGEAAERAGALLADCGAGLGSRLVGMAPGAAYGKAKQWPPRRFAELAAELFARHGARSILVGSGGDREAGAEILRSLPVSRSGGGERSHGAGSGTLSPIVDLIGRTDLPLLAGVMSRLDAFVSNDSGAMHLAAAAGLPVAAIFGSTDERATAPLPAAGPRARPHAILTAPAWCRPCLLRECPIDHRCMTRIQARAVADAIGGWLEP